MGEDFFTQFHLFLLQRGGCMRLDNLHEVREREVGILSILGWVQELSDLQNYAEKQRLEDDCEGERQDILHQGNVSRDTAR
jgi:hypothetical protein